MPKDMLFQSQIKEVVRDAYADIDAGAGRPIGLRGYVDSFSDRLG